MKNRKQKPVLFQNTAKKIEDHKKQSEGKIGFFGRQWIGDIMEKKQVLKKVTLRINKELGKQLEQFAKEEGISRQEAVGILVQFAMDHQKKPDPSEETLS